jgi:hypothetical protein
MVPDKIYLGVLLLEPSADTTLRLTGQGSLVVKGSVVVDSKSEKSVVVTGNGNILASSIYLSGNYSPPTGNGNIEAAPAGGIFTHAAPLPDPLAYLPEPSLDGLPTRSSAPLGISSGTATLSPGIYEGGISISKGAVTLSPGIYVLKGGGLRVSGQASLTGKGVLIYHLPEDGSDKISFTGGSNIVLTPPTDGTYKGITLMQSRESAADLEITGGGGVALQGLFYAPNAAIALTGNGDMAAGSHYIGRTMTLTGKGNLSVGSTDAPEVYGCFPPK